MKCDSHSKMFYMPPQAKISWSRLIASPQLRAMRFRFHRWFVQTGKRQIADLKARAS